MPDGICEQVEKNDRKPAALQKQQPTSATPTAAAVATPVDRRITITATALSLDNSDNHNHAPENPASQTSAVAAVAAAAAAAAEASAAAAAALVTEDEQLASPEGGQATQQGEGGQQRPRPENIPKFVRVGSKVCFSTVVAAVLIPSSEDITAASKKELW